MKAVSLITVIFCLSKLYCQTLNNTDQFYYDFHPMSTLALGKSFDPNHLGDAKVSPIKYKEKRIGLLPETAALTSFFDAYLVTNKEELDWAFSFDSKVSARAFKVKANSSLSLLNNFNFKKNSVYFVINARSEFTRTLIEDIEFTEFAAKYANKPKKFEEIFGDRIVTMVRKGTAVWLLISIDNASQSLLNQIKYSGSASGKFGPLKGSAEMSMKNEIKSAKARKTLSVQIITNGGVSIGEYDDIINKITADVDDFDKLKKTIAEQVFKKINVNNAAPIGYHTTSLKSLGIKKGWKLKDKVVSAEYEDLLLEMAKLSNDIDNRVIELNHLYTGRNARAHFLEDEQLNLIKTRYVPELEQQKAILHDYHTETLFKYDDIDEADFANARSYNDEIEYVKKMKIRLSDVRGKYDMNFPNFSSLFDVTPVAGNGNVDTIKIISKNIESVIFRVYYDDISNTGTVSQKSEFPLCITEKVGPRTIQLQKFNGTNCKSNKLSDELWGQYDNVDIILKNFFIEISDDDLWSKLENPEIVGKIENTWDLYLVIRSPYYEEKEVLVGRVYVENNKKHNPKESKNGMFYLKLMNPDMLAVL